MKKQILLFSLILICYNDDTVHECLRTEELAKQLCESIKFDGVNNCIYSSDGSCNEGYRECTKYNPSSDFEESKCTSISPSDSKYKCVVEAQGTLKKCVQKLKSCNEYTEGTDCKNLKADEGYRCVLYNGQCKMKIHAILIFLKIKIKNAYGLALTLLVYQIPEHVQILLLMKINMELQQRVFN